MAKSIISKNQELANKLFENFEILDIYDDPFGIVHLYTEMNETLGWHLKSLMRENRPVNMPQVMRLHRDMKNEEFIYLCEPVHVDSTGHLFNFQHRLEAFLKLCEEDHNSTLPVEICVGFTFPGFEKLDKTKVRTKPQDMKLRQIPYFSVLPISLGYILSYLETKDFQRSSLAIITSSESLEFLTAHPEINTYASQIASQQGLIIPSSWLIAMRYIYGLVDQTAAETFINQIVEQRGLDHGMPAYAFKKWTNHAMAGRHGEIRNRIAVYTLTDMFIRFRKNEQVKLCRTINLMPDLGL